MDLTVLREGYQIFYLKKTRPVSHQQNLKLSHIQSKKNKNKMKAQRSVYKSIGRTELDTVFSPFLPCHVIIPTLLVCVKNTNACTANSISKATSRQLELHSRPLTTCQ